MSDYNDLVRMVNRKHSLHLIEYPTGRWGFVGSIPIELCHRKNTGYGDQWVSNVYDNKQDAELAAKLITAEVK